MAYEFKLERRVEFADTDMAGVMHFAAYFRFMESTEHSFFRSLGLSVFPHHNEDRTAHVGWPRSQVSCNYRAPLHFDELVEVHLLVREKRSKAITYDFLFRHVDGESGKLAAHGRFTVVCILWDEASGRMKATTIPPEIAGRIEVAPEELLP